MTAPDQVRDHQARSQSHLVKLRMLARREVGAGLTWQVIGEVRDATSAIIAEAEAAGGDGLAVTAGKRRKQDAEAFLRARLTRLAGAADEAVNAARGADASGLRTQLRRFDALTTAIWAVQEAVHGEVPPRRHRAGCPLPPSA